MWVGDSSPGSREAEGEGGEGFYIAQSGRCLDLLVIGGQNLGEVRSTLPFRFWRVRVAALSSRELGEAWVSRMSPR
jgi:hypothetical protein